MKELKGTARKEINESVKNIEFYNNIISQGNIGSRARNAVKEIERNLNIIKEFNNNPNE